MLLLPSLLQQMNKQEGDNNQAVVAFFGATKLQREGLKGRSLFSSSHSGSRLGLASGALMIKALMMEFMGPLQVRCCGFASAPTAPKL